MTTLSKFIKHLQQLELAGHGGKDVYYRVGSSGDCGRLGTAQVTNVTDECGPFCLNEEEEYVSVYAGN